MGLNSTALRILCAIIAATLLIALSIPTFGKVTTCQKSRTASNLRSVALCYLTVYYASIDSKQSVDYQSMEALLRAFIKMDIKDSGLIFDVHEKQDFEDNAPQVFGYLNNENKQVFVSEILDYPVGFSFAVYEDPSTNASTKPLLWTRGLHRFNEFDQRYVGYVAYADGHVLYFDGAISDDRSMLEYTFGEASGYTESKRILEHMPESWDDQALAPLPIRFAEVVEQSERKQWLRGKFEFIILPFGCGLIAAAFCIGTPRRKLAYGLVVFGGALVLLLIITFVGFVQ